MSNFHDFLVEHAMFPFPKPDEARSIDSTDVSEIEVGLLKTEWKAKHSAMRDDTLVQKLCDTLQDILRDRVLPAGAEKHLLVAFSPKLQVSEYTGTFDREWLANPNEAHVSLPKDFFVNVCNCIYSLSSGNRRQCPCRLCKPLGGTSGTGAIG